MPRTLNRRFVYRWAAFNATGVSISISIDEYVYHQCVKTHVYNPPREGHLQFIAIQLAFLILLGALQALACCWSISRVQIRSAIFQVAIGVSLGVLTALLIPFLGVFLFAWFPHFGEFHYGAEPLIGIYAFLISGIVFGSIVGYSQANSRPQ
jgi:hypothetical protein